MRMRIMHENGIDTYLNVPRTVPKLDGQQFVY
jgi:hypothetical protein